MGKKKSILTWLIYNFSGFPIWIGWGKVFQKIACQNLNKLKGLGVFLLGKLCFPWYLDQKWFCPRCFAHTSQDKVSCFMWAPGRPENIRIYFFLSGFRSRMIQAWFTPGEIIFAAFLLLLVLKVRCKWHFCWHFSPWEEFRSHPGHFLGLTALWMSRGLS